ncbi:MAG TPA: hypothetical protein VG106_00040, partial [Vicinamibacterales bacterium]|nr:hypothetical protein [Vicinamibacterales bacterium]
MRSSLSCCVITVPAGRAPRTTRYAPSISTTPTGNACSIPGFGFTRVWPSPIIAVSCIRADEHLVIVRVRGLRAKLGDLRVELCACDRACSAQAAVRRITVT